MAQLRIRINNDMTVVIDGADSKELIKQGAFWSELPKDCVQCGAELVFSFREPKDAEGRRNEYYGMRCMGYPAHETNFGQYREASKGLFYKREWHDAFQGSAVDQDVAGHTGTHPNAPTQNDSPQFPSDPVAKTISDMVTTKQLGMIRAISRENNLDPEEECMAVMKCKVNELSRRAASSLIDHLLSITIPSVPIRRATAGNIPADFNETGDFNSIGNATAQEYAPPKVDSEDIPL